MTRTAVDIPENPGAVHSEDTNTRKLDRLVILYEGILTATARVRTGKQAVHDPENFRSRMKQALAEVEAIAARRGYLTSDVKESTFAVVAFLDEVILTASGASAAAWVGKSLGEELFDQRSAGELFFKRLESLHANRDSQVLAEILEVYYHCLLLGFEGKFAGSAHGELVHIMSTLRDRVELILGQDPEFSPDRRLPFEAPPPPASVDPLKRQFRLFALAACLFAVLCYVAFSFELHNQLSTIRRAIEQRISTGGVP